MPRLSLHIPGNPQLSCYPDAPDTLAPLIFERAGHRRVNSSPTGPPVLPAEWPAPAMRHGRVSDRLFGMRRVGDSTTTLAPAAAVPDMTSLFGTRRHRDGCMSLAPSPAAADITSQTTTRSAAPSSQVGNATPPRRASRPSCGSPTPPLLGARAHSPASVGYLGETQPVFPPVSRSHSEGECSSRRLYADAPRSHAHHYEVDRFRRLRKRFGVTAASYARAFPDDLTELGSNWRERLNESVSEGKSGSFFYRVQMSGGSRFIVKQITRREKQTLMSILPLYEEYITRRNGRSLIQYFGCHSISLPWRFSERVFFIVMRNFIPAEPWLVFDLKGATANRRALATRFLHQLEEGTRKGFTTYGTLRDWEWMDIAMVVDVDEVDKASLAEMITADAQFLADQVNSKKFLTQSSPALVGCRCIVARRILHCHPL